MRKQNDKLTFGFTLETEKEVKILISSVEGRLVKTVKNSSKTGLNQISIDLSEFDSGTYFYSVELDNNIATGTIIKK